jgi:hypothetical protein
MHDPLYGHDEPRGSAIPAILDADDDPDRAPYPERDGSGPDGPAGDDAAESGSLVTEYGLLAVVAATIAGVLIQWATGGAIINLFNALVDRARDLVGA